MPSNKRGRRPTPPSDVAAESGPDDGIDPKLLFRAPPRRDDRHVRRLCSQVRESLSFALAGACSDDVLQSLWVVGVDPAPDATRLQVTVCAGGDDAPDPGVVHAKLAAVAGLLRAEVAASIHRRRAPELAFRVVPAGEVAP